MAPSNLIAALEELAKKRNELTSAIVTLATVAGVDAAPYLSHGDANSAESMHLPLKDRLRDAAAAIRTAPETPPRPQRPAPPTTNGAGLDDKVLRALKAGPLSPSAIREATGINGLTLPDVTARLRAAKRVKVIGTGRGTTYQLA